MTPRRNPRALSEPFALATLLALAACSSPQPKAQTPKPAQPVETVRPAPPPVPVGVDPQVAHRAEELLNQMTIEEKLAYIGGERNFFIRPIERLGIPEIKLSDGPAGCRNWGPSTAYPAPIAVAAAFDTDLAERVGHAMGRDCRARGVHILLGPGVNIQRSPLNGRNFEYLGEDPYLAGKAAVGLIRGVQGEGVLATVKHFAANNQEWDRNHVSSQVDERTLREIYLPAFEMAVKEANVGSVMTAYNPLNGEYSSHSSWLLRTVLKNEWGFNGFVMSDWGAAHDTLGAVNGGLDLEMPSGEEMSAAKVLPLIRSGKVDPAVIDDQVRRILRTLIGAGFFDRPQKRDDIPLYDPTSSAVALEAARKGSVLLKNEGNLLPLDRKRVRTIAVVGPNADPAVYGGSGSAYVTPLNARSVLEGIKDAAPDANVLYHPGIQERTNIGLLGAPVFDGPVTQEIFRGKELEGAPVATSTVDRIDFHPKERSPAIGVDAENYSIRWTGKVAAPKAGKYTVIQNADDGIRVYVDGNRVLEDWSDHAPRLKQTEIELSAGSHDIVVEYFQGVLGAVAEFGLGPAIAEHTFEGEKELRAVARKADVVIVCVGYGQRGASNSYGRAFDGFWPPSFARDAGLVETEDSDRPFSLPRAELETLRTVAAANAKSVVVANAGGGVSFDGWLPKHRALLWAWYPGQEGGTAVAELLFGDQNPSGKLPVTFAKRYEDHPSAPFYQLNENGQTPYREGVFVGYRGFDEKGIAPEFPFGFGLSYTTFEYSALSVEKREGDNVRVVFSIKNSGKRAGDELVQLYVAPPKTALPRPPQELKGFVRVALAAGETGQIELELPRRAFAAFVPRDKGGAFQVAPGKYEIRVAASSRDARLTGSVELAAATLE